MKNGANIGTVLLIFSVTLAILKMAGIIEISWIACFAPVIASTLIGLVALVVLILGAVIYKLIHG